MSQPQRTDREVGGDQHDLAVGDAEHVTGLAAAHPGQRLGLGHDQRGDAGARRRPRPWRRRPRPSGVPGRAPRARTGSAARTRWASTSTSWPSRRTAAAARSATATSSRSPGRSTTSCAWVAASAVTISASTTGGAGRALEHRRSGVVGQPADLRADDDHQHGPLADEPAGCGLVGEPDHGDPVRPSHGDPGLDRGADVVAVQVDVPEVVAVADDRDAVAQLGQPRAQAVDGVRGRVEQVHHLVVVLRRARLARGDQRGPVPAPGRGGGAGGRSVSSATRASRRR